MDTHRHIVMQMVTFRPPKKKTQMINSQDDKIVKPKKIYGNMIGTLDEYIRKRYCIFELASILFRMPIVPTDNVFDTQDEAEAYLEYLLYENPHKIYYIVPQYQAQKNLTTT